MELAAFLRANPPRGFKPSSFYDERADFLTVHFSEEESYGEDVGNGMTLLKAFDGGKVTGFKLYGARRFFTMIDGGC